MTTSARVLEVRMRRRWRILVGLAVPGFTLLIAAASFVILSRPGAGFGGLVAIAIMVAVLGGLIIIPGVAVLLRLARGAPDVRLDEQGITWGNDRDRDLAIDWSAVEAISTRAQKTQYVTDRLFVVRPRAGVRIASPRTIYGRFVAIGSRMTSGSRYSISTLTADHDWATIREAIERHLGRPIDEA